MAIFATRLCEALDVRHITAAELSRKLGINEGTISQYKKGLYEPKQRRLQAIAEALNVSIPWLMGADVPMNVSASNIIPLDSVRYIPLVGDIACGTPILAEQNIERRILLPDFVHADFALRCKGNSMINANISDGDIAFIRIQPEVENGEIAAVQIENFETEATLKRVYTTSKSITLVAENPNYEPLIFTKEEMNAVSVAGKCVAILKIVE